MLASQKEDVVYNSTIHLDSVAASPLSPFSGWPSYPVTAERLTYLAEVILKSRDIQWNPWLQPTGMQGNCGANLP